MQEDPKQLDVNDPRFHSYFTSKEPMHPLGSDPYPSRRPRSRFQRSAISCLILVLGLAVVSACGADQVQDAAISELAIGSWGCAPDAEGAGELPFTVQIEGDGTFGVSVAPNSRPEDVSPPRDEISGTWAIEDGDLEWGFDDIQQLEMTLVEGFDTLSLESTEFTLTNPGIFEANDGTDDPAEEQDVLVDVHGTDSVTLSVPGGGPWTCDRQ